MKINHKIVAEHLGVKLRGNETFTELLEIEKQVKANREEEKKWAMFPNYETPEEKKQRRAEENANIQRVDAQTKKHWSK
jgi:cell fate (sporulation/competence/biofilm development) regulator YlbF (YheA/YmcA/DUF963 family)